MKSLAKLINKYSLHIITYLIRANGTARAFIFLRDILTAAAYAERGYESVGGEWLLIIGLTLTVWNLTGYVAELIWGKVTK